MQKPNERLNADARELQTDAAGAVGADAVRDGDATKSTQVPRWMQLAYDLEQCDDAEPENRREVF